MRNGTHHDPHPGVVYEFCLGRGAQYPVAFLGGKGPPSLEPAWNGTLITDQYAGYNGVLDAKVYPQRKAAACAAHARRRFEELTAAYFRAQGLRAVCNELSRQDSDSHGDGGIDIRLYRDSRPEPYAIVQCKARSKESDLDMVRAFFGVMAANRIANGYYVSCNGFTGPACDFARDNGVTLISGQQLLDSLNYLPAETIA